ncbi:MAG: YfdX family protein [Candidatus Thiothrix putei]|uniref:YfdX family protein n=1 Tax=Candidatus Thiothrix putei TaxID=3080811 RepID=A0AA95HA40_9GAMM|nr:MAG: YfdX family protein [Candidatus Thiothrix putei]
MKTPTTRKSALALAVLLATTLVSGTPYADTAAPAPAPVAVEAGTAVQNEVAVEALKAIQQASTAVSNKDIKAAQTALDQAATHLKAIEDSLPTAKIKQALAAAKSNPDSADWTSIYQELDKLTVFLPAHSTKAAADSKPADPKATDTKTDTAKPGAETLDAALVALQYTEIDMPVANTLKNVEQAQADLHKEKLEAAGKALKQAENSVVVLQNITAEPLYQAHYSLWQALATLKNGTEADAKRYLDDAIGFLEKAASSTDKASKEAADKLLVEGKALKADLEKGGKDTASSLERFGLHTEAWAERAINYAASKAAEMNGDALHTDLIEARFHLTNAAIDLGNGSDQTAAKAEMELAQTNLNAALQQADNLWSDAAYKQKVTDVQAQVAKLLQEQPETLAGSSNQLHQFRQELQTIIHSL